MTKTTPMTKTTAPLLLALALLPGCKHDDGDADDSTGVAECDEYLKKAQACLAKFPDEKDKMEAPLEKAREVFKAQLAAPGGSERLKLHCQQRTAKLSERCR